MTHHAVAPFFDVLIVGAGLSGIGAAWHLQRGCPGKTHAILEARAAPGGHMGSVATYLLEKAIKRCPSSCPSPASSPC
jgi:protoporphyrinogen oxidase